MRPRVSDCSDCLNPECDILGNHYCNLARWNLNLLPVRGNVSSIQLGEINLNNDNYPITSGNCDIHGGSYCDRKSVFNLSSTTLKNLFAKNSGGFNLQMVPIGEVHVNKPYITIQTSTGITLYDNCADSTKLLLIDSDIFRCEGQAGNCTQCPTSTRSPTTSTTTIQPRNSTTTTTRSPLSTTTKSLTTTTQARYSTTSTSTTTKVPNPWKCVVKNGKQECVIETICDNAGNCRILEGEYANKTVCESACISEYGWNCNGNDCIKATSAGNYPTYQQCIANCVIPNQTSCGNIAVIPPIMNYINDSVRNLSQNNFVSEEIPSINIENILNNSSNKSAAFRVSGVGSRTNYDANIPSGGVDPTHYVAGYCADGIPSANPLGKYQRIIDDCGATFTDAGQDARHIANTNVFCTYYWNKKLKYSVSEDTLGTSSDNTLDGRFSNSINRETHWLNGGYFYGTESLRNYIYNEQGTVHFVTSVKHNFNNYDITQQTIDYVPTILLDGFNSVKLGSVVKNQWAYLMPKSLLGDSERFRISYTMPSFFDISKSWNSLEFYFTNHTYTMLSDSVVYDSASGTFKSSYIIDKIRIENTNPNKKTYNESDNIWVLNATGAITEFPFTWQTPKSQRHSRISFIVSSSDSVDFSRHKDVIMNTTDIRDAAGTEVLEQANNYSYLNYFIDNSTSSPYTLNTSIVDISDGVKSYENHKFIGTLKRTTGNPYIEILDTDTDNHFDEYSQKVTTGNNSAKILNDVITLLNSNGEKPIITPFNNLRGGVGAFGIGTVVPPIPWISPNYGQSIIPNSLSNITNISAGYGWSMGLKNDGTVHVWGNNDKGQCRGHNSSGTILTTPEPYYYDGKDPVTINGDILTGVSSISAGGHHGLALVGDKIVAWGHGANYNQGGWMNAAKVPTNGTSGVSKISAGDVHNLFIKSGKVYAWGWNNRGECLGTGIGGVPLITTGVAADGTIPVKINDTELANITSIAGSRFFSLALNTSGKVYAWGDNNDGQCTVPASASSGVSYINVGTFNSYAIKNGKVIAWGSNLNGECLGTDINGNPITGIPTGQYVQIMGKELTNVIQIVGGTVDSGATAKGFTIALKDDGTVVSWGVNFNGQCLGTDINGNPIVSDKANGSIPFKINGSEYNNISNISCGAAHTMVLQKDNITKLTLDETVNIYNDSIITSTWNEQVVRFYLNPNMISSALIGNSYAIIVKSVALRSNFKNTTGTSGNEVTRDEVVGEYTFGNSSNNVSLFTLNSSRFATPDYSSVTPNVDGRVIPVRGAEYGDTELDSYPVINIIRKSNGKFYAQIKAGAFPYYHAIPHYPVIENLGGIDGFIASFMKVCDRSTDWYNHVATTEWVCKVKHTQLSTTPTNYQTNSLVKTKIVSPVISVVGNYPTPRRPDPSIVIFNGSTTRPIVVAYTTTLPFIRD